MDCVINAAVITVDGRCLLCVEDGGSSFVVMTRDGVNVLDTKSFFFATLTLRELRKMSLNYDYDESG